MFAAGSRHDKSASSGADAGKQRRIELDWQGGGR
jgi:hypothetical protein